MNYTLTDHDVRMFLREAPKHSQVRRALPYMATPLIAALIVAGGLNILVPKRIISQAAVIMPATTSLPTVTSNAVLPKSTPTPEATPTPLPITLPENTLATEDLKISAPVQWNVGFTDKEMNAALPNGLIQLAGSAVPGQKGMVNIAGHSSNYPWVKGKFNSVYAPLTKAKAGMVFEINYQNTMYRYQVTKVYEVNPNDTGVLSDNSETGIRLITCTPVGTSLHRLIVEAQQIFPDPNAAAPFSGAIFSGSLPADQ